MQVYKPTDRVAAKRVLRGLVSRDDNIRRAAVGAVACIHIEVDACRRNA